jgi:hypothetical protein
MACSGCLQANTDGAAPPTLLFELQGSSVARSHGEQQPALMRAATSPVSRPCMTLGASWVHHATCMHGAMPHIANLHIAPGTYWCLGPIGDATCLVVAYMLAYEMSHRVQMRLKAGPLAPLALPSSPHASPACRSLGPHGCHHPSIGTMLHHA